MTLAHTRQGAAPAASAMFRTAGARFRHQAEALWLARRSKTAQARAAGIPIGPGERVLTVERAPAGALVAATAAAVYVGDQGDSRGWCRLGWEEVTRVGWHGRRHILALTGTGPGGVWRQEVALDGRSTLAELARDLVSATQLATAAVWHDDRVCAVVMARRQPRSGKVIWVTLLGEGDNTGDQALRVKAAAAIATLRAQTGIPAG